MTPVESLEVTLQVGASPTVAILTTLEVSFMLLDNIYSAWNTRDDCNLRLYHIFEVQATGPSIDTCTQGFLKYLHS